MSLRNPMGDFEVTDPKAMRALAHPVRLQVLSRLQRYGPSTATQLSADVGATPSVTSWHLRHLATFGLVADWDGGTDRRQRWWQATTRGFRFGAPEDPADEEGRAAYLQLSDAMLRAALEQTRDWMVETEPDLEPEWQAVAGVSNTSVPVTAAEAEEVLTAVDDMLARFVHRRDAGEVPEDARTVRFLRLSLPGSPDD
jgi:DNA-binding transcriptional ArsR family regulator